MNPDNQFIQYYESFKLKASQSFQKVQNSETISDVRKTVKGKYNEFSEEISNLKKFVRNNILGNEFLTVIYDFVEKSNNKNDVKINISGKSLELSYKDRKQIVLGVTLFSLVSLMLVRRRLRLYVRNGLFVYLFSSLFLCRENLNPFY